MDSSTRGLFKLTSYYMAQWFNTGDTLIFCEVSKTQSKELAYYKSTQDVGSMKDLTKFHRNPKIKRECKGRTDKQTDRCITVCECVKLTEKAN